MTQTSFPSTHHERLNILTGSWETKITALNTDGSEGQTSKATDIYRWMPNGQFLLHDVDAIMGGQRMQSMEIFAVDPATGDFPSRSYDADGSTNDFVARISGRNFTIEGETQRFSGAFSEDGRRLDGQWRQRDGEQWLPFVRIRLHRRG